VINPGIQTLRNGNDQAERFTEPDLVTVYLSTDGKRLSMQRCRKAQQQQQKQAPNSGHGNVYLLFSNYFDWQLCGGFPKSCHFIFLRIVVTLWHE